MKFPLLAIALLALLTFPALALFAPPNETCSYSVLKDFGASGYADSLARLGDAFFVDSNDRVYRSVDNGLSWEVRGGFEDLRHLTSNIGAPSSTSPELFASRILANYRVQVMSSRDDGRTWLQLGGNFSEPPGRIMIETRWIDGLRSWETEGNKLYSFASLGNYHFFIPLFNFTEGYSQGWRTVRIADGVKAGNNQYYVVNQQNTAGQKRVLVYENNGLAFTKKATLQGEAGVFTHFGNALVSYDNKLFLLIYDGRFWIVRKSYDNGTNWYPALNWNATDSNTPVALIASQRQGLSLIARDGDVYRSWTGSGWKKVLNLNSNNFDGDVIPATSHSLMMSMGSQVLGVRCNAWPVLNGPAVDAAPVGQRVQLNSTIFDYEGDTVTRTWEQVSGPSASITGASTANAYFTPTLPGSYQFRLKVRDNGFPQMPANSYATLNLYFTATAGTASATPVPSPTPTPTVEEEETTVVNASAQEPASSPQPLPENSTDTIEPTPTPDASTPTPAADVSPQASAIASPTPQTISATPTETPSSPPTPSNTLAPNPVVEATSEVTAVAGEVTTLTASGSDPAGMQVSFSWRQLSGVPVVLQAPLSANPSLVATVAGEFVFEVVAVAADGRRSAPATVHLNVTAGAATPTPASEEKQNTIIALLQQVLDLFKRLFGQK